MAGLSPKLPVVPDDKDGFKLNKTYRDMVIQNLKNVLLTIPGEKMMDPEFGVGLRKFLFEQNDESTFMEIRSRTYEQIRKYLPFIQLEDLIFSAADPSDGVGLGMMSHFTTIELKFKIIPLGLTESLKLP